MNYKSDQFETRLKTVIARIGSVAKAARMTDVAESTVRKWRDGISDPQLKFVVKLAEIGKVNIAWLATGEGYMALNSNCVREESTPYECNNDDYYYIPMYSIEAAAGQGRLNDNEHITERLAFRKSFIKQSLTASVSDLALVSVSGDSMEPTLKSSDTIMIDQSPGESVTHDGIYVLRIDRSIVVKRLQSLPENKILISSDNPAYKSFELNKQDLVKQQDENGAVVVIGRVVWTGRKI